MTKKYPVKVKGSLAENMQLVIPVIFDDCMSYRDTVLHHPRLKQKLHEMRIACKPMRYIMEIMLSFFGVQFEKCYDEIRKALELMGEIHDCDVFVPELVSHLREIREFNRIIDAPEGRLSTGGIRNLAGNLRERRELMYAELCGVLRSWVRERFREKLVRSMNVF